MKQRQTLEELRQVTKDPEALREIQRRIAELDEQIASDPYVFDRRFLDGLVRLPVAGQDILVFSNIDTPRATRERSTVWASFDGGQTWPIKRLMYDGPSAYSSLTAGRPGTPSEGWIYLHFEGGPAGGSQVARFNLTWLLQGEATGDGNVPRELRE